MTPTASKNLFKKGDGHFLQSEPPPLRLNPSLHVPKRMRIERKNGKLYSYWTLNTVIINSYRKVYI